MIEIIDNYADAVRSILYMQYIKSEKIFNVVIYEDDEGCIYHDSLCVTDTGYVKEFAKKCVEECDKLLHDNLAKYDFLNLNVACDNLRLRVLPDSISFWTADDSQCITYCYYKDLYSEFSEMSSFEKLIELIKESFETLIEEFSN